jgi:proteasome assembly chaperone (PAC2) family protein
MSQNAGYKVKVILPLPAHPIIVICLPGDGYVGKFCGESLITSTSAEIAVQLNPYDFPPHVTIDKGTLILHGYQFYVNGIKLRFHFTSSFSGTFESGDDAKL